jgi:hypothetical protein
MPYICMAGTVFNCMHEADGLCSRPGNSCGLLYCKMVAGFAMGVTDLISYTTGDDAYGRNRPRTHVAGCAELPVLGSGVTSLLPEYSVVAYPYDIWSI